MTKYLSLYAETRPLKEGDAVQVEAFEAGEGTPTAYVRQITELNFRKIPTSWQGLAEAVYLARVLKGDFAQKSKDCFFIAKSGEAIIGITAYQTSRRTPDLGSFGWVHTHPDQRGRGISSLLTELAIQQYQAEGGMCLHLGTVNPIAHHIYANHGFRDYRGIVMRYVAPQHEWEGLDQHLFGTGGPVMVRRGNWGDVAGLATLFAAPSPWLVKDYGEGIYSLPETDARRYVSVPASLLLRTEQRSGSMWVLENEARHIVATANVLPLDSTLQRQIRLLDFLVHPMAIDHARTLLTRVIESEREEGVRTLRAYLAGCDDDKRALLQAVGFQARATLPDQLAASDQRWDLVIYDLTIDA